MGPIELNHSIRKGFLVEPVEVGIVVPPEICVSGFVPGEVVFEFGRPLFSSTLTVEVGELLSGFDSDSVSTTLHDLTT